MASTDGEYVYRGVGYDFVDVHVYVSFPGEPFPAICPKWEGATFHECAKRMIDQHLDDPQAADEHP